jgi:hypothetical protein
MQRTIAFQRQHWQTESTTFFNADLKLWSLADVFVNRWANAQPEWTPEKVENFERLKRVYYQMHHRIWPGALPRDVQERYLFLSNCQLLDRAVNITVRVVDYCANEAMPNLNFTRRTSRSEEGEEGPFASLWRYIENVSPYREHSYYGYRNRDTFILASSASKEGGGSTPFAAATASAVAVDPHAWIRPRLVAPPAVNHSSHSVDYRVYRAATRMTPTPTTDDALHGPANFNLFDWVLVVIEDWFGYALGSQADTWFEDVKRWILNPNTSIEDFRRGDVGLAYYIRYPFVCQFPDNLNCSAGVGFEQALLWVTVGFIGLFVFAAFFFPPIALPFQIIGIPLAYIFIFTVSAAVWRGAALVRHGPDHGLFGQVDHHVLRQRAGHSVLHGGGRHVPHGPGRVH